MNDQITEAPRGQERLQEILLSYVEAAEVGAAPDREAFLAAHSEFADDIVEFLAGYHQIHELVTPLRQREPREREGGEREPCEGRGAALPGMPATWRPHAAKEGGATEAPGAFALGEDTSPTPALGQLGD